MAKLMVDKIMWLAIFFVWWSLTISGTFLLWFMPMGFIEAFVTQGPTHFRTWGVLEYAETGYFQISESIFSCYWTWPDTFRIFPKPLCLTFLITLFLWGVALFIHRRLVAKGYT